jgi:hypothetical protein
LSTLLTSCGAMCVRWREKDKVNSPPLY